MSNATEGQFRRVMGPWTAGALIAGTMIGTGIFIFVADVAGLLHGQELWGLSSKALILGVWIVGALLASCGALCLAELASTYPETGGVYVFLRRAYGKPIAFLYSWAESLIMWPGSLAIMALGFARFTKSLLGGTEWAPWVEIVIAMSVVVILSGVNIAGAKAGGRVQNIFTLAKILCLGGIIVVGGAYAAGLFETHPIDIQPAALPEGAIWGLIGAALVAVMWTYGGWDISPFVAEEVRNPTKNLPRSILGGLWIVALLFVLVNAAYLFILTPAELGNSTGRAATLAMERAMGPGAQKALSLALMISTFGAINGLLMVGGRLTFAAGRDHALFRWFGHTDPELKTPVRGLMLQAVITNLAILIFKNPFVLLLYTGLAYWLFAALMALSVIVLRMRDGKRKRPFRVWLYPVLPIIFIAAAAWMAWSVIQGSPQNAAATGWILGIGILVYILQGICGSEGTEG